MDHLKEDIDRERIKKEDTRVIFVLSFVSVCMILIPIVFYVIGK